MEPLLLALRLLTGCNGPDPVVNDTDSPADDTAPPDTDDTSPPVDLTQYDTDGDGYLACDEYDNWFNLVAGTTYDGKVCDCDDTLETGSEVYQNLSGFRDADFDTYTAGSLLEVCSGDTLPEGYALNQKPEDCDDENVEVNPGMEEICNDDVDNNCNGSDDGCILTGAHTLAEADAELTGEANNDYAGNADGIGDINGDGYDDVVVGAYMQGTNDAGAAYIKYGPFSGISSLGDADVSKWTGENTNDQAGISVAGVGDVNGDGRGDVVVGARYQGGNGPSAGAAYLITSPTPGTNSLADATAKLMGADGYYDFAGVAISRAGDQDGDGNDDFLVGSPGYDGGVIGHGAAYLLGSVSGTHTLDEVAKATIIGNETSDGAGFSVAGGGDVDGDGTPDVLVGAHDQIELFYGPVNGSYLLSNANTRFLGTSGEGTGYAEAIGDLDGDGYDDIVMGIPGNDDVADNSGTVSIVYSPPPSGDFDVDAGADAIIRGAYEGQVAGNSVTTVDLDGDGNPDVVVGAPDTYAYDHYGIGNAFVFYGPVFGEWSVTDTDLSLAGVANGNLAGGIVASAGDINRDGVEDLLVSAGGTVVDGYGNSGAAYLLFGSGI